MHRFCATVALIGGVAIGTSASADIVYSGAMSLKVIDDDGGLGEPAMVTIEGYSWEFGFVVGGPLDYAFINAQGDHAGLFTTGFGELDAKNFAQDANIGFATPFLEMYPIGGSGANSNLEMHDYLGSGGEFAANGSGYVGFAFGTVGNRRYGWMSFDFSDATDRRSVTLTGYAYNDDAGGSILAGQTAVVPGAGALAGLLGVAGLRARRRRG